VIGACYSVEALSLCRHPEVLLLSRECAGTKASKDATQTQAAHPSSPISSRKYATKLVPQDDGLNAATAAP
jgi:hypothetical protein